MIESRGVREPATTQRAGGVSMNGATGKVIVNQTITADGYSAGPNQSEQRPFGEDGGDGQQASHRSSSSNSSSSSTQHHEVTPR